MDCRIFRKHHVAYVDGLLCAADMSAMDRHRVHCAPCSRHDTAVRRALLVVRNLPSIEPSSEFLSRLSARIEAVGPVARDEPVIATRSLFSPFGTFAAVAAGIAAVAYLAVSTNNYFDGSNAVHPAALAVAAAPQSVADYAAALQPLATQAMVASVPTGMPVWPAMVMVGQAPVRFASMELGAVGEPH